MLNLIKNKRSIRDIVGILKFSLSTFGFSGPKDITKFVFLCGANKDKSTISERRKALLEFSQQHLPHTQFFLAERIFTTLRTEEHKGNWLDLEHDISMFADNIIIVLESPSSFTELGAFSHDKLRSKLIIINDSQFKKEESFINMGPIKAVCEASSDENILYYKMSDDGIDRLDSIGDVFHPLYELLKEPLKGKITRIALNDCNPAANFNKTSAMFVHDLIYFTGPILHKELVELAILLFGDANFKLKEHLAILNAFGSITRNAAGLYRSQKGKTYYLYKFDTNILISTFRNYVLKLYPERIYEY
jgi:hypothetical protein